MRPSASGVVARWAWLAVCCVAFVGVCSHAEAQWGDRSNTAGAGIRIDRWEIHPGVAARAGYDNNVFKGDGDGGQPIQGSGMLAVTPHVNITSLGKLRRAEGEDHDDGVDGDALPKLALRSGLSATYFKSFQDYAPSNIDVDTDAWVGIMPQRPLNLELSAAYQRSIRPFTANTGDKEDYITNSFRPTVRVNVQNHRGVLTGYGSYSPSLTKYKGDTFSYLNAWTHGGELGMAWRFLPSTALLYDLTSQAIDYTDNSDPNAPIAYADTLRFRMRSGLNGAITKRFSLRVLGGYSAVLLRKRDRDTSPLTEVQGVVGEAIATYAVRNTLSVDGGYIRDVAQSGLGGALTIDRVRAALRLSKGKFSSFLEAAYGHLDYGRVVDENGQGLNANGSDQRKDHKIDVTLHLEYALVSWLSVLGDLNFTTVQTDFEYVNYRPGTGSGPAQLFPDPAGYTAVSAFGGLRAYY